MTKTAIISDCGKYRYLLMRQWNKDLPSNLYFIGVNPSTADAEKDDPTIKKLICLASAWGYGGFHIVNLFAYRSSDPAVLLTVPNPVGPENDLYLANARKSGGKVVLMWGSKAKDISARRVEIVFSQFKSIAYYLRLNRDGSPAHPLYLPASLGPIKFG